MRPHHHLSPERRTILATQRTNITTSLKLKVENGTTDAGAVKYATRTFSSINPAISDKDRKR